MAPLAVDAATLALSHLVMTSGKELGAVTADLLADPTVFEAHPAVSHASARSRGSEQFRGAIPTRTLVLLGWLFQVGHPLPPGRTVSSDAVWLARNAQPVLAGLTEPTRVGR